ncbi:hypothetical protein MNB_ARC-1_336 [hydrothermal vent metagenome]|uniref:Uncharacterized protein n=1 Tax=hydrothermal vent metagenome TaxID=652676 RepID=A0A3B1E6C4_9ZZZZ
MNKFVSSILIISSLLLFTACGSIGDSVSTSGGGSTGAGGSNPTGGGSTGAGGSNPTGGGSTTPTNQNYAPTIDKTLPNISLIENSGTTPYDINISDVDGDELNLSIESNDTTILTVDKNFINPLQQADYQNQTLDFNLTTVPNALGIVRITITVDDGDKNSIKFFDINVTVDPNIFQSGDRWKGLVYNTVISPHTGKIWLDRNLGASKVCTGLDEEACYGNFYQWGRSKDGHEQSDSSIIYTQATSTSNVGHGNYIAGSDDWANTDSNGSIRNANWSKTDGTSICPIGYRVPTIDEIRAETIGLIGANSVTNQQKAFNSFLKLPSLGYRFSRDGTINIRGAYGGLWSSSVAGTYSSYLDFDTSNAKWGNSKRAGGFPVRCIKN